MTKTFRVVAVNIKTGARRTIADGKRERAAEAICDMAVIRRGVEDEYFVVEEEGGDDGNAR